MERQTDRQTGPRLADRQTVRQTDRKRERQRETERDREHSINCDKYTYGSLDVELHIYIIKRNVSVVSFSTLFTFVSSYFSNTEN